MDSIPFLDLANADPQNADVILLPLPFDATTSYGRGTAKGPSAIWEASTHVELWDEEVDFDLESLRYHSAPAVVPKSGESPGDYLTRVRKDAALLHKEKGLIIGIGGEHSVTPPLVEAACPDENDLSGVTIVQVDAHADLRDSYHGTPHSHACAMHRVIERGARVVAIGIRSADREEFEFGLHNDRVETFFAQQLAENAEREAELLKRLTELTGDVYLTFDIDGLDVSLCPGTGTPVPGGLSWWQSLRYLRCLLHQNRSKNLIGCDIVETVPQAHMQVNEITAAKLLTKVIAYAFHQPG